MSAGKILLGVLGGAAAGAALSILFAPEKGSVTRKQISKKGDDVLGNLKTKYDDLLSKTTKEANHAKSEAESLLTKGKKKVQETKKDLKTSTAKP